MTDQQERKKPRKNCAMCGGTGWNNGDPIDAENNSGGSPFKSPIPCVCTDKDQQEPKSEWVEYEKNEQNTYFKRAILLNDNRNYQMIRNSLLDQLRREEAENEMVATREAVLLTFDELMSNCKTLDELKKAFFEWRVHAKVKGVDEIRREAVTDYKKNWMPKHLSDYIAVEVLEAKKELSDYFIKEVVPTLISKYGFDDQINNAIKFAEKELRAKTLGENKQ